MEKNLERHIHALEESLLNEVNKEEVLDKIKEKKQRIRKCPVEKDGGNNHEIAD